MMNGMRCIVIVAVLWSLVPWAHALGQEAEAVAPAAQTPDPEIAELRAELAAIKAELKGMRGDLKQVLAELRAVKAAQRPQRNPTRAPDTTVYNIDIGSSPVRGPADAKATIVEFGSFTCGWCIREWPTIQKVMAAYPNDVRFVFKNFPRNQKDRTIHGATMLALQQKGPDAFWEMHDKILANPKKNSTEDLRGYAGSLGLDLGQFDAVLADAKQLEALFTDDVAQARKCKVRGTPSIFINGLRLSPRGLDNYKKRIERILKGGGKEGEAAVKKPDTEVRSLQIGAKKPAEGK